MPAVMLHGMMLIPAEMFADAVMLVMVLLMPAAMLHGMMFPGVMIL